MHPRFEEWIENEQAPGNLPVTLFESWWETKPIWQGNVDATSMVTLMTVPVQIESKEQAPGWSPIQMAAGGKRGLASTTEVSALVLDYDAKHPVKMKKAHKVWKRWYHVIHTSYSHSKNTPSYRVVLPLSRPVPARLWSGAYRWARNWAGGDIDRACSDASRFWYLPCYQTHSNNFRELYHKGPLLNLYEDVNLSAWMPDQRKYKVRKKYYGTTCAETWRSHRDPPVRLAIADRLEAKIQDRSQGRVAYRMRCPGCRKASVWFIVDAVNNYRARCNHTNSCGWSGWLDELMENS